MENIGKVDTAPLSPPIDLVLEGERLFNEGQVEEARDIFLKAVEQCPGNALAWNNLAVIAMTENDDQQAEKYLRQALEVKGDFLEASFNLVEIYDMRGDWRRAARELRNILSHNPSDIQANKRLVKIYIDAGQEDKAREALENCTDLGAMKSFIDSLWLGIKYCSMRDDLSPRDQLEKYTLALLKFFDGLDGQGRRYKLVSVDPEDGRETVLEDFSKYFYYKEDPSPLVDPEGGGAESLGLVLTIGNHPDWHLFREALREEIRSEGGCLGDFTQSKKVLRRESVLSRYDVEATLKYFRDNVGPCDCHALRAVLV